MSDSVCKRKPARKLLYNPVAMPYVTGTPDGCPVVRATADPAQLFPGRHRVQCADNVATDVYLREKILFNRLAFRVDQDSFEEQTGPLVRPQSVSISQVVLGKDPDLPGIAIGDAPNRTNDDTIELKQGFRVLGSWDQMFPS